MRLLENGKQLHVIGTWTAECCGEEGGWTDNGAQIVKVLVNQLWLFLEGLK